MFVRNSLGGAPIGAHGAAREDVISARICTAYTPWAWRAGVLAKSG